MSFDDWKILVESHLKASGSRLKLGQIDPLSLADAFTSGKQPKEFVLDYLSLGTGKISVRKTHSKFLPWGIASIVVLGAIWGTRVFLVEFLGERELSKLARNRTVLFPIATPVGQYVPKEAIDAQAEVEKYLTELAILPSKFRIHSISSPSRSHPGSYEFTGEGEGSNKYGATMRSRFAITATSPIAYSVDRNGNVRNNGRQREKWHFRNVRLGTAANETIWRNDEIGIQPGQVIATSKESAKKGPSKLRPR